MALSRKIKKILEIESAAVISKGGEPHYVVMTWEKYRELAERPKKQASVRHRIEESVPSAEDDIDIGRIPV